MDNKRIDVNDIQNTQKNNAAEKRKVVLFKTDTITGIDFGTKETLLISYLGKKDRYFEVDRELIHIPDKNGRDMIGLLYGELLLKLITAMKITSIRKSGLSKGRLLFRKQRTDLFGFDAALKKADINAYDKLVEVLSYYREKGIITGFQPILDDGPGELKGYEISLPKHEITGGKE